MLRPKMALLALLLLAFTTPAPGAGGDVPREIRVLLDTQAAAWNRGDLPGYMAGYDRNPSTTFLSGATVTRGWEEVLARYGEKYGGKGPLPALVFTDIELKWTNGTDAALVFGRWKLALSPEAREGTFTLLLLKKGGAWRIVHDHSS
jgi:ketosteroid isomerase-like protein